LAEIILGVDSITMVIPPVTVRELNSIRILSQSQKRIKNRAGKALIKLQACSTTSAQAKIKNGVELYLKIAIL